MVRPGTEPRGSPSWPATPGPPLLRAQRLGRRRAVRPSGARRARVPSACPRTATSRTCSPRRRCPCATIAATDPGEMAMTVIVHESDADLDALRGQRIAVVGYGNQGRSWALNLRDCGLDVTVCVRADATREQAEADGFEAADLDAASSADVVCVLVPDDAIPDLPLQPKDRRAGDRGQRLHARVRPLRPRLRRRHGRAPHARARGAPLLRGGHRLHHRLRRAPRRDRPRPRARRSPSPRRSAACARVRSR